MTTEQPQHDSNEKHPPQGMVEQITPAGASRRRFTKTGIAASGVLVTLASRPALGCTVGVSPSVYCSGNVSGHGPKDTSHPGCPPSYWTGNCDHGWPATCKKTTLFQSCTPFGKKKSSFYDWTLIQILDPYNNPKKVGRTTTYFSDPSGIAKYLVAAYMNNLNGRAPFLTIDKIRAMYEEGVVGNGFIPNNGAKAWTKADIMTYLGGTWD